MGHHHFGHHHHHFGHHHHHRHFGHHHRHHHFAHHHRHGCGTHFDAGAIALGAAAGLSLGALAGSVLAKPSKRFPPQEVSQPVVMTPNALTNPALEAQVPLGVASIRLPIEEMQEGGGVQLFAIDVFPNDGGAPWRVMRRYNQFYDLCQSLDALRWIPTPFPRKHLTGCSGSKLESRRRGLESWLAYVVTHCPGVPAWTIYLQSFLEVPTAGESVQLPVAPPIASAVHVAESLPQVSPPLPTPAEEPSQPTENIVSHGRDIAEGMIMEITVPSGVSPGQMLDVSVPNGQQVLLEVPQGVVADQVLQVWYDPVQRSLTPFM